MSHITQVGAGLCRPSLADLGADVIKIERPGAGDDIRTWGPPFAKDGQGKETTEAAYYLAVNRNKKSVTLDISVAQGQALIKELVSDADILAENYKVGQLAKYGLDYKSLKAINPDLIYCSITGFGQTGPYASLPGYDFIVQGLGGFMSVTGEPDTRVGGGPKKAGVAIADLFTGAHATIAILAALAHRDRTGEGQWLDICLLDVQVAMMANMAASYLATEAVPQRWGNAHPNIVPYQVFKVIDGWIIVACGNDSQFSKLVEVGAEPSLAIDPRFATNPNRVRNRDALIPLLEVMMARMTSSEWIEALGESGVPCGPINDMRAVFSDPQVVARGMKLELAHRTAGTVCVPASALKMGGTPVEYRTAPPLLGEHTEAVLQEVLGLSQAQASALRSAGVI